MPMAHWQLEPTVPPINLSRNQFETCDEAAALVWHSWTSSAASAHGDRNHNPHCWSTCWFKSVVTWAYNIRQRTSDGRSQDTSWSELRMSTSVHERFGPHPILTCFILILVFSSRLLYVSLSLSRLDRHECDARQGGHVCMRDLICPCSDVAMGLRSPPRSSATWSNGATLCEGRLHLRAPRAHTTDTSQHHDLLHQVPTISVKLRRN